MLCIPYFSPLCFVQEIDSIITKHTGTLHTELKTLSIIISSSHKRKASSVAAALRKPSSEQGRFGMLGGSNPEQSRRLPMYQARITPAHQTLPTKLACYTKYIQDTQLTQPQNIKPVIFKSEKYPTLFYFALLQKCCFDCWSFTSHLTSRPFHSYAYAYLYTF